jgi:hypothetical protein
MINQTSVKTSALVDDFQEVKMHKAYVSNDISQRYQKLNKPVPTSTAVKYIRKQCQLSNCSRTEINCNGHGNDYHIEHTPRGGDFQKSRWANTNPEDFAKCKR